MKKIFSTIFFFILLFQLSFIAVYSQNKATSLNINNFSGNQEIYLVKNWKFNIGDNLKWADSSFNDIRWDSIEPNMTVESMPENAFSNIIWFRLNLDIDSSLLNLPLTMTIEHFGASDLYIDGKLFVSYGKPSNVDSEEISIIPTNYPKILMFLKSGRHLVAIRYSNHNAAFYRNYLGFNNPGIYFFLKKANDNNEKSKGNLFGFGWTFLFGFLLALSILHVFIYLYYRNQKSNLYYSIFTICLAIFFLLFEIVITSSNPLLYICAAYFQYRFLAIIFLALLWLVYSIFYLSIPKKVFLASLIFSVLVFVFNFFISVHSQTILNWVIGITITIVSTVSSSLIGGAMHKKKEGVSIIGRGFQFFIFFVGIYYLLNAFFRISIDPEKLTGILLFGVFILCILSIPITMSIYLARNFAKTNKNLQLQLIQVKELSNKTLEQEIERKKLIEGQKEELEIQVKQRTAEVVAQKEELQIKNKNITDSINYAERIQQAKLPRMEDIYSILPQSFILFKPKDIVSGDFYFFHKINGLVIIAAADCTGHGVPGAFMSMIGLERLDDAVSQTTDTSEILKQLNKGIKTSLRQSESDESTRDGMDMALCSIDLNHQTLKYAGANRPLWIIRKGKVEIEETKATKKALGGLTDNNQHFDTHLIKLFKDDTIFIFSDGYVDQFNSEGKKLMSRKFKEILLSIQDKTMKEQKEFLNTFFEDWKSDSEQTDDVLVIGIRV